MKIVRHDHRYLYLDDGRKIAIVQGGSLPATDSFTAANGTALETYNSSWTIRQGTFAINTNSVYNDGANDVESGAYWNADTFANDQYSQIVIANNHTGDYSVIGPGVRFQAGANSYYGVYANNITSGAPGQLFKVTNGTWTQFGSNTADKVTTNDVLRLEVSGTTLTAKKNGSTLTELVATDNSFASGQAGIASWVQNAGVTIRGDNWEGGNLGGASPVTVTLSVAALSAAGQTISTTAAIPLNAAVVTATGQVATVVPGVATVAANVATLVAQGQVSTVNTDRYVPLTYFYSNLVDPTVPNVGATRFGVLILDSSTERLQLLSDFRTNGFTGKALHYKVFDYSQDTGIQYYPRKTFWNDTWAEVNVHEDWFLHSATPVAPGNRVPGSANTWYMDPGSSGWTSFVTGKAVALQATGWGDDFDGVFLDNVPLTWNKVKGQAGANLYDGDGNLLDESTYLNECRSHVAALRTALGSSEQIWGNMIRGNITGSEWNAYMTNLDGGMEEGFIGWDATYLTNTQQDNTLTQFEWCVTNNKGYLAIGQGPASNHQSTDAAKQLYALANYLLAAPAEHGPITSPTTAFRYTNTNEYGYFWNFANYNTTTLGAPLDARAARTDGTTGFIRHFENGIVRTDLTNHLGEIITTSNLIDINHDDGTTLPGPYTATSGTGLAINATAQMANTTNGLEVTIPNTTAKYCRKDVTNNTTGKLRVRIYLDPNGINMTGGADPSNFVFLKLKNSGGTDVATIMLRYKVSEATYTIRTQMGVNGPSLVNGGTYAITDAPHYIEIYLQRASNDTTVDGSLALYIDGTLKETINGGTSNYTVFNNFNNIHVGAEGLYAGTTGTIYLDELVVNDTGIEIGPVVHNPISVSLGTAALVAGGQTLTAAPGVVTVTVASAAIAAQGQVVTVVPGAVTLSLNAGALTAGGQSLTISTGLTLSGVQVDDHIHLTWVGG